MSGIPPGEVEHALTITRRPRPDGQPHTSTCGDLNPDHDGDCAPEQTEENSRYLIDLATQVGGIPLGMIEPDGPVTERDAADAENAATIDRLRENLMTRLTGIAQDVRGAEMVLRNLCADHVYDVEYAEGAPGVAVTAILARMAVDAEALIALAEKANR